MVYCAPQESRRKTFFLRCHVKTFPWLKEELHVEKRETIPDGETRVILEQDEYMDLFSHWYNNKLVAKETPSMYLMQFPVAENEELTDLLCTIGTCPVKTTLTIKFSGGSQNIGRVEIWFQDIHLPTNTAYAEIHFG